MRRSTVGIWLFTDCWKCRLHGSFFFSHFWRVPFRFRINEELRTLDAGKLGTGESAVFLYVVQPKTLFWSVLEKVCWAEITTDVRARRGTHAAPFGFRQALFCRGLLEECCEVDMAFLKPEDSVVWKKRPCTGWPIRRPVCFSVMIMERFKG